MRIDFRGLIMFYLLSLSSFADSFFGLASRSKVFENPVIAKWINGGSRADLESSILSLGNSYLCHVMGLSGKQGKICRREHGYTEFLMESLRLSSRACQKEFQFERWNCSLDFTRRNLLRKATKESAALTAFAAAGLTYAVAKGCSSGQLNRCSCEQRPAVSGQSWVWGGCGDNIREGRRQTQRFFRLARRKKDTSLRNDNVEDRNVHVGISVVKYAAEKVCRCHGISGSCTMQTCFTKLLPFKHAARNIHHLYRTAKISDATSISPSVTGWEPADTQSNFLRSARRWKQPTSRKKLFSSLTLSVTADSPNFCVRNKVSHGVNGRRCHLDSLWKTRRRDRTGSCDHLCCGKNNSVARYEEFPKNCNCSYGVFNVSCRKCRQKEMRYYCRAI